MDGFAGLEEGESAEVECDLLALGLPGSPQADWRQP